MLKNISILVLVSGVLVACGGGGAVNGLAALGADFARAFAQNRNDDLARQCNLADVPHPRAVQPVRGWHAQGTA